METSQTSIRSGIARSLRKVSLLQNYFKRRDDYYFRKNEEHINRGRIKFISECLPKNGVGAELGVFKGYFSPILLEHSGAKLIHLIDPWYFLTPSWHWGGGNRSTIDALIKVLQAFKSQIEQGRVVVHVGDDCDVLSTFSDNYFDWVYVDSSHEYSHTVKELEILSKKVKLSGIIAGDDWQSDPDHRHHGVYRAVCEFVRSNGYDVLYSSDNDKQWAIRKAI